MIINNDIIQQPIHLYLYKKLINFFLLLNLLLYFIEKYDTNVHRGARRGLHSFVRR